MKPFCIDEIREVFRRDMETFLTTTHNELTRFVASPDITALETAGIQAHAMRGVAAMIHADGLAKWGRDLEALYERAGALHLSGSDEASLIAQFVLDRSSEWWRLVEHTLAKQSDEAVALFREMHDKADYRWPNCLPDQDAPLLEKRSNGSDTAPKTILPSANFAGVARRVKPPRLRIHCPRKEEPESANGSDYLNGAVRAEVSNQTEAISPSSSGVAGFARRLAPPKLKVRRQIGPLVEEAPVEPDSLEPMARQEIGIYLDQLSVLLYKLTIRRDDDQVWADVRRVFYTIKSSAEAVRLAEIRDPASDAEVLARRATQESSSRSFDVLEHCVEAARRIADAIGRTFTLVAPPTIAPAVAAPVEQAPAEALDAELIRAIVIDALDSMETLESTLLAWEKGDQPAERREAAYRQFHTLKGAANSVGLNAMGASMHDLESLLDRVDGETPPPEGFFPFLLGVVDQVRTFARSVELDPLARWPFNWKEELDRLATGTGAVVSEEMEAAMPADEPGEGFAKAGESIRLDVVRLRKLLNQAGELVIDRNRFAHKIGQAKEMSLALAQHRGRLGEIVEKFQHNFEFTTSGARTARRAGVFEAGSLGHEEFSDLELDRYDDINMLTRTLAEAAADLGQLSSDLGDLLVSFQQDDEVFLRNSRAMQSEINMLAMQPVGLLFRRVRRVFRDALDAEKKQGTLIFEGEQTLLDKSVIDRLHAPLLHLVRNAVAHGLESPEEREAAGKPVRGTVTVSARQVASRVVISVADDGGGLRFDKIIARAKADGLIAEDTEATTELAIGLLFRAGFSTAEAVSSVRGRGVGLDVVQEEIEALQGSVQVESREGLGAKWNLHIPLTLAITEAVIVSLGGTEYALPLNYIESAILVDESQLLEYEEKLWFHDGVREVRAIPLATILGLPSAKRGWRGLFVAVGDQRALLIVDAVVGRREIAVKLLDTFLTLHPAFDGGTLDAEGRPMLILNVPHILKGTVGAGMARVSHAGRDTAGALETEMPVVLVVDDSLSVRTVQQRLLTQLGCEVVLAVDGLDAIDQLRNREVDIVFTDLEMPRMNGFDLLLTVRAERDWTHLPIVLITSRAGQKYLDKAFRLGASDYLPKPFGADELSAMLQKHIGFTVGKS